MKRNRLLALLLCLCMVFALLPTVARAAMLSYSLDVTVEAPVVGQKPADTATVAYTMNAVSTVTKVEWSGQMDQSGCFTSGVAYTVTVTQRLSDKVAGRLDLNGSNPKINGQAATLVSISADGMEATASYTFASMMSAEEIARAEEEAKRAQEEANEAARVAKRERQREISKTEFYTKAQADAAWWKLNQRELILDGIMGDNGTFYELNQDDFSNITRLLLDYPDATPDFLIAGWIDHYGSCFQNIQEVWLSPQVDARKFLDEMERVDNSYGFEGLYKSHSGGVLNGMLTIFVHDSQLPRGLLSYSNEPQEPTFSVKVYSGDVYDAYEQGASAGRDWCPGHEYTGKIQTASRMYQNITCQRPNLWYYSCKWCGKCEYNPNHTFSRDHDGKDTSKKVFPNHEWEAYDLSDKNYIGTNERGEKVYSLSCIWCGLSYVEYQLNYTYAQYLQDMSARDNAESREGYQYYMNVTRQQWAVGGVNYDAALESSVDHYSFIGFAVDGGKDTNAKMSTWAQDGVHWAAQNDLIDAALLGSDYTGNITRLQFCSVAVKMAEKMLGKTITPAPSGTFTDTDSEYVRKAVTAGITNGNGDGTFAPNSTLTRQQMATFLYRALMYVKNNSDIRYTIYDSKLSSYTDAGQLQSWAIEPMAFMNALGLVNGTSATTLAPNANCTIEQALVVANRSLSANIIGWYQSLGGTERNVDVLSLGGGGSYDKRCFYALPGDIESSGVFNQLRYRQSERFWVTGAARSEDWITGATQAQGDHIRILKMLDPYTGNTLYIQACDFRPIKAD